MVQAVDAKLDLRRIYNRAGPRDFIFSLGAAPSIEALTNYWNRMVSVAIDVEGGIIHVRANAFTPGDATAVASAILAESGALVNRLSNQAREDAVRFARDELDETQEKLKVQRAEDRRLPPREPSGRSRRRRRRPDGAALGDAERARQGDGRARPAPFLRRQRRPARPPGRTAHRRDRKRIDDERSALGAEGPGTTLTDVVGSYEALRVDLEFAQAAYTQALAAETAARAEARRQSRYLAPHVTPTSAEDSLYPRRALLSGLALLFLFLGWGILMLFYYNVRDGSR